jgi:uncharacterized protein YabN with tetrapyrrole methylase and pyrophosphatase domain
MLDRINETINNETIGFSTFNQSTESSNFFENVYHSIQDVVKASEQDIYTITGKIKIFY